MTSVTVIVLEYNVLAPVDRQAIILNARRVNKILRVGQDSILRTWLITELSIPCQCSIIPGERKRVLPILDDDVVCSGVETVRVMSWGFVQCSRTRCLNENALTGRKAAAVSIRVVSLNLTLED